MNRKAWAALAAAHNLHKYYSVSNSNRQEKIKVGGANTAYRKKSNNPNMGRPTTNPKNNRLEIRLTDSEKNMLDECVRRTGGSKTDVIVKGILMVYKETQK